MKIRNAFVPAQLDSLACIDSRQIGPYLIWRGSNWVKESQYGLDHETAELNESVSFWPLLIIEFVARVSQHVLFTHDLLVKQV